MQAKIRRFEDPTIAEDLLALGQLDDHSFAVQLALKPACRIRQLHEACGIDPSFMDAPAALREYAVRIARRHFGSTPTTLNQEAA